MQKNQPCAAIFLTLTTTPYVSYLNFCPPAIEYARIARTSPELCKFSKPRQRLALLRHLFDIISPCYPHHSSSTRISYITSSPYLSSIRIESPSVRHPHPRPPSLVPDPFLLLIHSAHTKVKAHPSTVGREPPFFAPIGPSRKGLPTPRRRAPDSTKMAIPNGQMPDLACLTDRPIPLWWGDLTDDRRNEGRSTIEPNQRITPFLCRSGQTYRRLF